MRPENNGNGAQPPPEDGVYLMVETPDDSWQVSIDPQVAPGQAIRYVRSQQSFEEVWPYLNQPGTQILYTIWQGGSVVQQIPIMTPGPVQPQMPRIRQGGIPGVHPGTEVLNPLETLVQALDTNGQLPNRQPQPRRKRPQPQNYASAAPQQYEAAEPAAPRAAAQQQPTNSTVSAILRAYANSLRAKADRAEDLAVCVENIPPMTQADMLLREMLRSLTKQE